MSARKKRFIWPSTHLMVLPFLIPSKPVRVARRITSSVHCGWLVVAVLVLAIAKDCVGSSVFLNCNGRKRQQVEVVSDVRLSWLNDDSPRGEEGQALIESDWARGTKNIYG